VRVEFQERVPFVFRVVGRARRQKGLVVLVGVGATAHGRRDDMRLRLIERHGTLRRGRSSGAGDNDSCRDTSEHTAKLARHT